MQFAGIVHRAISDHRRNPGSDAWRRGSKIPDPIPFAAGHDFHASVPSRIVIGITLAP
jgi:hypothetical protein